MPSIKRSLGGFLLSSVDHDLLLKKLSATVFACFAKIGIARRKKSHINIIAFKLVMKQQMQQRRSKDQDFVMQEGYYMIL